MAGLQRLQGVQGVHQACPPADSSTPTCHRRLNLITGYAAVRFLVQEVMTLPTSAPELRLELLQDNQFAAPSVLDAVAGSGPHRANSRTHRSGDLGPRVSLDASTSQAASSDQRRRPWNEEPARCQAEPEVIWSRML